MESCSDRETVVVREAREKCCYATCSDGNMYQQGYPRILFVRILSTEFFSRRLHHNWTGCSEAGFQIATDIGERVCVIPLNLFPAEVCCYSIMIIYF